MRMIRLWLRRRSDFFFSFLINGEEFAMPEMGVEGKESACSAEDLGSTLGREDPLGKG